jgi:hypothetical protein
MTISDRRLVTATSLAAAGLLLAAARWRGPSSAATDLADLADRRAALRAYLRDHLSGADAAITVLGRLRWTYASRREGRLFDALYDEFVDERAVVKDLLIALGASPASLKRLATRTAGAALSVVAGGNRGDLALFRTLESLAIGVQGKRCMWRAAQEIRPSLRSPGRDFADLESRALDQWEAIDYCRRSLVAVTLAV